MVRHHIRDSWRNQECFAWREQVLGTGFRNMKGHLWHMTWIYSGDLQKMTYKWNLLNVSVAILLYFPTHNTSCLNSVSDAAPSCFSVSIEKTCFMSCCLSLLDSSLSCLYISRHCPVCANPHFIFWNTNLSHMLIIIIFLDSSLELPNRYHNA